MMHRLNLLLIDLALVALATFCALVLRDNLELSAARLLDVLPYTAVTLAVAAPVFAISGLHRSIWRASGLPDYLNTAGAVLLAVAIAVALAFVLYRLEGVARSLPILQALLAIGGLVGIRVLARLRCARRRSRPPATAGQACRAVENVLVVGLGRVAELYLAAVAEAAGGRLAIVGVLGGEGRHAGRLVRQRPVLGRAEDAVAIVRDLAVHGIRLDRIVVTGAFASLPERARAALLEVERSTGAVLDLFAERERLAPAAIGERPPTAGAGAALAGPAPAPHLREERHYWRVKRALDAAGATLLIILCLPVAPVLAAMVALEVGRPLLFWQQRPGRAGRPFRLYKLRTMAAAHDRGGARLPDEQRVGAIGRLLRRTRLDELPQLYNVLIGDMSLVGPRPLLEADQTAADATRLRVRPGLTGWAQVAGGRLLSAADKASLDAWYVRNASLVLDLEILARTLPTILFGERVDACAIRRARGELPGAAVPSAEARPRGAADDGGWAGSKAA